MGANPTDRHTLWTRAILIAWAGVGGCVATPSSLSEDETIAPRLAGVTAQEIPPDNPVAVGGERLSARFFTAGDSAKGDVERFRDFYDNQLKMRCSWAVNEADGTLRCMPNPGHFFYLGANCESVVMANEPVADSSVVLAQGDLTSVTVDQPDPSCQQADLPVRRLMRVGAWMSPRFSPVRMRKDASGCAGYFPGDKWPLFELEPADASALARAELRTVQLGAFTLRVAVGEDGSRFTLGVTDRSGAPCTFLPEGPCVPGKFERTANLTSHREFADARCETPAFSSLSAPRCGDPRFLVTGKERDLSVRSVSPASEVFRRSGPMCEKAEAAGRWLALGADVTASLPSARAVRHGNGPLYQTLLFDPELNHDALLGVGRFMDESGRACTVLAATDGTYRCLSDYSELTLLPVIYSDPSCKNMLFGTADLQVDIEELIVIPNAPADDLPRTLTHISRVQRHSGDLYAPGKWGFCGLANPAKEWVGRQGLSLVAVSEDLPLSTLPAVIEVAH